MEVDLRHAQPLGQLDPVLHLVLGHVAEVEQVGALVDRLSEGPGTAQRRLGQLLGRGHDLLHHLAELVGRATDQGHLGPREAEPRIAGRPQPAARLGQLVDLGFQVQGQGTSGQRLARLPLERQRQIDEDQFLRPFARQRNDFHQQVARLGGSPQHRLHARVAKPQFQQAVLEFRSRGGVVSARLLHRRHRRVRRRTIVLLIAEVDPAQAAAIHADRPLDIFGLEGAGHLRLGGVRRQPRHQTTHDQQDSKRKVFAKLHDPAHARYVRPSSARSTAPIGIGKRAAGAGSPLPDGSRLNEFGCGRAAAGDIVHLPAPQWLDGGRRLVLFARSDQARKAEKTPDLISSDDPIPSDPIPPGVWLHARPEGHEVTRFAEFLAARESVSLWIKEYSPSEQVTRPSDVYYG